MEFGAAFNRLHQGEALMCYFYEGSFNQKGNLKLRKKCVTETWMKRLLLKQTFIKSSAHPHQRKVLPKEKKTIHCIQ